jgi:hypothetical protein
VSIFGARDSGAGLIFQGSQSNHGALVQNKNRECRKMRVMTCSNTSQTKFRQKTTPEKQNNSNQPVSNTSKNEEMKMAKKVKKAAKKPAKKMVRKAAKKSVSKTVRKTKKAAKKPAKKAARKTVRKVAKKSAKKPVRKARKMARKAKAPAAAM